MDFIRDSLDQGEKKSRRCDAIGFVGDLDEGEFRCAVYRDEKIELSLRRLHFGDVDVKEADRIRFELLLRGLVACDVRQPADPMPLQAAVQR